MPSRTWTGMFSLPSHPAAPEGRTIFMIRAPAVNWGTRLQVRKNMTTRLVSNPREGCRTVRGTGRAG